MPLPVSERQSKSCSFNECFSVSAWILVGLVYPILFKQSIISGCNEYESKEVYSIFYYFI